MTSVFLIAGEASGDALGAALMIGLRSLEPAVSFEGVAGPQMQAQGMGSLFPMEELSVMGIAEVLPKYRQLKRRIAESAQAILKADPDVVVTIDSPDFCLRAAKIVKAANPTIRICHYVAPSVWAWRPGRARKMVGRVDQVLALLPFEPPYMEAVGLRCDFVGHPIVSQPQATEDEARAFRAGLGIGDGTPLLLALPGSRKGEVERLAPVFGASLARLRETRPDMSIVLPVAPGVAGLVREMVVQWSVPAHVLDPSGVPTTEFARRKRAAFRAADFALAASGTVSLELAAAETPMVIAYDMNWLTMRIMRSMARIDTVTLVNLVSETRTVPELLGEACRPELIVPALDALIAQPDAQIDAMRLTMQRLGRGGEDPGLRAARAVLLGLADARAAQ